MATAVKHISPWRWRLSPRISAAEPWWYHYYESVSASLWGYWTVLHTSETFYSHTSSIPYPFSMQFHQLKAGWTSSSYYIALVCCVNSDALWWPCFTADEIQLRQHMEPLGRAGVRGTCSPPCLMTSGLWQWNKCVCICRFQNTKATNAHEDEELCFWGGAGDD